VRLSELANPLLRKWRHFVTIPEEFAREGSSKSTRLCFSAHGHHSTTPSNGVRLLGSPTVGPLGNFRMPPCALLQIDNRVALSQSVEGGGFRLSGVVRS
jgi:hypothetical protein